MIRRAKRESSKRQDRGFSLIELLVVVGIAVIIMVISVRFFATAMDNYHLDISAHRLESKLHDARINAIKRNRQVWLSVDIAARTFQVQAAGPVDIGPRESLGRGMIFVTPTNSPIAFNSLGHPSAGIAQTLSVRSTSSSQVKTVTITPTGRISVN